ncbi:type IV secretory system conjugative DNA transfer family protein [Agrobacterium tumefaciens]|uniref:Uncharacterized protein n=1 Tax=Agrobacterium tumefaciens TaxID=358 RepID=A0A176WXQ9_AGRTU|nr:type IV secretory system conjugative DNA transfer family protein [Agrobacterium tumefaciens]OAE37626.1 hypothetical protein A7J57_08595 [Agrobacterium tumefaciens]
MLWIRNRNHKERSTYGDAGYATTKQLQEKGYVAPRKKLFRKVPDFTPGMLACLSKDGQRIFTRDERSVLMMAQPGAGKSQHFIADLKATAERANSELPFLIIGDAGNELFNAVGPILKAAGYQISKIDAVKPEQFTKYDFLAELDTRIPARHLFKRKLAMICESMIPQEKGTKQPHFVEFARLLLKCAITADVLYEGNKRTIVQIIEMLLDDDEREALLKRAAVYDDKILKAVLKSMQRMLSNPEGGSVMSTALRTLEPWADPAIEQITTFGKKEDGTYYRGWNFTKLLTQPEPVVLFIRSGYQDVGGHLSRLIYECAVDAVSGIWDATDKPLRRKLHIYVDEAGLTGYCAAIVKAFSRLRKVGAHLRMCFVSMDELKDAYPYPHYKTLLNGCDLIISGGGNDMDLSKFASELAGEFTVQSHSQTESKSGESRGRSEQRRRLENPDEIRAMVDTELMVFLDNLVVRGIKPWRKVGGKIEHL